MSLSTLSAPAAATLIALFFGAAGVRLSGGRRARLLVPLSGLLLGAVAVFGLIPELALEIGWLRAISLAAAGFGILTIFDHLGYPVCPSCSHGGKFAGSLVGATAFHAFVDGWGSVGVSGRGALSAALIAAILLHKVPEGLALGAMLRASTGTISGALLLMAIAEIPTLAGGFAGLGANPGLWVTYPLAIVAGMFLFLGLHAVSNGRSAVAAIGRK